MNPSPFFIGNKVAWVDVLHDSEILRVNTKMSEHGCLYTVGYLTVLDHCLSVAEIKPAMTSFALVLVEIAVLSGPSVVASGASGVIE